MSQMHWVIWDNSINFFYYLRLIKSFWSIQSFWIRKQNHRLPPRATHLLKRLISPQSSSIKRNHHLSIRISNASQTPINTSPWNMTVFAWEHLILTTAKTFAYKMLCNHESHEYHVETRVGSNQSENMLWLWNATAAQCIWQMIHLWFGEFIAAPFLPSVSALRNFPQGSSAFHSMQPIN